MKTSFDRALKLLLVHEGGFVDHPRDPGGATNKGVTQAVYDAYRVLHAKPRQSVRKITDAEIAAIYRRQYWDAVRGDELPAGVDYLIFDYAVNSGPVRAAKALQAAVGTAQDGNIGVRTIAAVTNRLAVIDAVSRARLGFLQRLSTWAVFGKGWGRRVEEVRLTARGWS